MKNWFRLIIAAELIVIATLQATFWSDEEGIRKVWQLEQEIAQQKTVVAERQLRNRMLSEEVQALKEGSEAIEERARLDLGLIREGETFFYLLDK